MKFIFTHNLDVADDVFPTAPGEDKLFSRKYGNSRIVSQLGQFSERDGKSIRIFDGFVTVAGKLYHPLITGSKCPPIYSHSARHIDSGIFCMAEIRPGNPNGALAYFYTDSLSQYALYYYRSNQGIYSVSNCINTLEKTLKHNSIHLSTSFTPSVHNILFGGPVSDETHYSGIKQLEFNASIICAGDINLLKHKWIQLSSNYSDARDQAHASMMRHFSGIRGIIKEDTSVVADITGGADSRTLISFLMRNDLNIKFSGRCLTPAPHPDGQAAFNIMTKFGIPIGSLPAVNWRHEAALRINAAMFGGGRDIGGGLTSNAVFPNLVHIRGMFGGLSGATPGADILNVLLKENIYSDEILLDHLIARRTAVGVTPLIHLDAISRARADYLNLIGPLREEFSKEAMLPEIYLRTRSRSHFGHLARVDNWAKVSPDAFCNPWLIEARNHLPSRLSSKAKLNFDLTIANNVQLTFEPMANKVWDQSVVPEEYREYQQQMVMITSSTSFDPKNIINLMDRRPFSSKKPSYIFPLLPPSGVNRGPHDVYVPVFQEAAKLCVDSISKDADFWMNYSRDALISFAVKKPNEFQSHGLEIQALGAVVSAGISYLNLGIVPDVNELNRM